MKKNLLSLLFILSVFGLTAQVTLSPATILVEGNYDLGNTSEIVKGEGEMHNTSTEELSLRWEVVIIDAPNKWEVQLCDKNNCYAFNQLSNVDANIDIPVVLMPDSISIMDMGVKHKGTAGCGTYEIRVYSIDDPTTLLASNTYEYRINVDANCTVATQNFDKSTAKVFPNPTTDYFTITENPHVKSLQIFNIVGKQMAVSSFQNGDAVNIANFPNGLYLVRMLDKDGDVLKTTRLTKR